MKKAKIKDAFLEQLTKVPIVQVACEKVNVSRNSVYRWRNEDKDFCRDMEGALAEGEALVNDMSESQLLSLIREKNYPAISFWLRSRHPKFKNKIEVIAKKDEDESMNPEQEKIVKESLRLASLAIAESKTVDNINN